MTRNVDVSASRWHEAARRAFSRQRDTDRSASADMSGSLCQISPTDRRASESGRVVPLLVSIGGAVEPGAHVGSVLAVVIRPVLANPLFERDLEMGQRGGEQ
jgi:hypothetical protein